MPIITSVETQQHDSERVNVYLDGSFAFGASTMLVFARGLRIGQELDEAAVEELLRDDVVERALGAALNFLSFRPRSQREVEDYFRRKKTEPEVAAAVIERLVRGGMLDDREFARYWVESRQTFRPKGGRALRLELRQKGLDRDVIDEALQGAVDEDAAAHEAGLQRVKSLRKLDDREFFRRMVAYLQRRGFSYAVAAGAAKRLSEGVVPEDALGGDIDEA
jgi:regulatory protein